MASLSRWGIVAVAAAVAACGKGSSGGGAQGASLTQSSAAPPPLAPPEVTAKPPAPPPPASAALEVKLVSLQLFHPYATGHALPSPKEDASFDNVSGYDLGPPRFGVGLVVEAVNQGDEDLADVAMTGKLVVAGPHGAITCDFDAKPIGYDGPRFVTFTPATVTGAPGKWKADADDLEGPIRPSERIRMIARNDRCESLVMHDVAPTSVTGSLTVTAHKRFQPAPVVDLDEETYDLTVDGATLRIVEKKSQKVSVISVAAASQLDAKAPGGASLKHVRLHRPLRPGDWATVERAALKFEIAPRVLSLSAITLPSGEQGYLAGNLVVHAKDGAPATDDLAKLGVSLHEAKLADLAEAPPEVRVELGELTANVTDVKIAAPASDSTIEKGKRRVSVTWHLAVDAAKITARLGDKGTGAQGERTLKAERARVVRQLPCDGVQLVTTKAARAPSNKATASTTCAQLDLIDAADVTVTYDVERYEVPVALSFGSGKARTFLPVASQRLAAFDPR